MYVAIDSIVRLLSLSNGAKLSESAGAYNLVHLARKRDKKPVKNYHVFGSRWLVKEVSAPWTHGL